MKEDAAALAALYRTMARIRAFEDAAQAASQAASARFAPPPAPVLEARSRLTARDIAAAAREPAGR